MRRMLVQPHIVALFRRAASERVVLPSADRKLLERMRWQLINQRRQMEREQSAETALAYSVSVGTVKQLPDSSFELVLTPHSDSDLVQLARSVGITEEELQGGVAQVQDSIGPAQSGASLMDIVNQIEDELRGKQ